MLLESPVSIHPSEATIKSNHPINMGHGAALGLAMGFLIQLLVQLNHAFLGPG